MNQFKFEQNSLCACDSGLSAFTDICLAVYPMVLFWDLQIKPAKKVLLCVLFGSGLL